MSETTQDRPARRAPETEISVDLSQSDPTKAVDRRNKPADIAASVRDDEDGTRRSPTEKHMMKRLNRLQKNITSQFDQKLADQEARHQQELTKLRESYQGVSVERQGDAEAATAHERAMKAFEEQLAAANEKGDSAAAARITVEMVKADGAYHAKLAGTKQRADTTGAAAAKTLPAAAEKPRGPTPAGARFILANEDWWEDPDYAIEKGAAGQIYIALMNDEGYEANSDDTFEEVARRLKVKFPKLGVVAGKGRRGPEDEPEDDDEDARQREDRGQHRRRAPAGAIQDRGEASSRRQSGNRRSLSAQEIDTMRKVGLSPDNDRDVVQFMREANAMEASA